MKEYRVLEEKKQYLQCHTICTSEELWRFVECCHNSKDYVFRGVNEAKYMCYTSAQVRTKAELDQNAYVEIISKAIQKVRESTIIMDYLRAHSKDESDFQILALMQHYGCGTPIMDFSTNIDSALFFATDRKDGIIQTACKDDKRIESFISVYSFNMRDPDHYPIQKVFENDSEKLKELDKEAREDSGVLYSGISQQTKNSFYYLPFKELAMLNNGGLFAVAGHPNGIINIEIGDMSIEYDVYNERIDAQNGLFLFNGLSDSPYEEAALNWCFNIKNYCFNIHKSLENEIHDYLKIKNITRSTIYPETEESQCIMKELRQLDIPDFLKPLD